MPFAVGVDLGGTKISAGIVDDDGRLIRREELAVDLDDASAVCAQITELVALLGPDDPVGLGIGAAGIVDHETGYYFFGPNTGLRDLDLAKMAADAVGLPVRVDNDANCATWAEHRFGVGRGREHFMCVTLGTGIGGGFVIAGKPYRGAHGGAAEIGHMVVDPDGPPCPCGQRGCWEQFASGLALERMARERLRDHPESVLSDDAPDGRVRGPAVTDAARAGDLFARQLVVELGRWVGLGLGSLVNILEPERIAIAGGLVRDWDLLSPSAHEAYVERIEASDRRPIPEVLAAELGPDAGIVGAALLVLDEPN